MLLPVGLVLSLLIIYVLDLERARWPGRNMSLRWTNLLLFLLIAAIAIPLFEQHGPRAILVAAIASVIPTYAMQAVTQILRIPGTLGVQARTIIALISAFILTLVMLFFLVVLGCQILGECF